MGLLLSSKMPSSHGNLYLVSQKGLPSRVRYVLLGSKIRFGASFSTGCRTTQKCTGSQLPAGQCVMCKTRSVISLEHCAKHNACLLTKLGRPSSSHPARCFM